MDQNIKLKITKKVCKIRLTNFFPKNLEQSAKICWEARVLFGGEGVSKSLAHGQKYQIENHPKSVQNSVDKRFFPFFQKYAGRKNAKIVLFAGEGV